MQAGQFFLFGLRAARIFRAAHEPSLTFCVQQRELFMEQSTRDGK
jgi:hypothetical protein